MRIAFFGMGGPFSLSVLSSIATVHDVPLVVGSTFGGGGPVRRALRPIVRAAGLRTDPLRREATRVGASHITSRDRDDPRVSKALARMSPDLILIANYPWILPESVFGSTRHGAVNLHPSLLPRHRGALPLFWVYYHDDRVSGVTAHRVTAQVDSGPLLAQVRTPLERGLSVDALNERKGSLAGDLALETVALLEKGEARGMPDDSTATRAPTLAPDVSMVDFTSWPAERVWHFLAGLYPRFKEPLVGPAGQTIRYFGVSDYREGSSDRSPGSVDRDGDHWIVHCLDGLVRLRAKS